MAFVRMTLIACLACVASAALAAGPRRLPDTLLAGFTFALQHGTQTDRSSSIGLFDDLEAWPLVSERDRLLVGSALKAHVANPQIDALSRVKAAKGIRALGFREAYPEILRWLEQPDKLGLLQTEAFEIVRTEKNDSIVQSLLANIHIINDNLFIETIHILAGHGMTIKDSIATTKLIDRVDMNVLMRQQNSAKYIEDMLSSLTRLLPNMTAANVRRIFPLLNYRGLNVESGRINALFKPEIVAELITMAHDAQGSALRNYSHLYLLIRKNQPESLVRIVHFYEKHAKAIFSLNPTSNRALYNSRLRTNTSTLNSLTKSICNNAPLSFNESLIKIYSDLPDDIKKRVVPWTNCDPIVISDHLAANLSLQQVAGLDGDQLRSALTAKNQDSRIEIFKIMLASESADKPSIFELIKEFKISDSDLRNSIYNIFEASDEMTLRGEAGVAFAAIATPSDGAKIETILKFGNTDTSEAALASIKRNRLKATLPILVSMMEDSIAIDGEAEADRIFAAGLDVLMEFEATAELGAHRGDVLRIIRVKLQTEAGKPGFMAALSAATLMKDTNPQARLATTLLSLGAPKPADEPSDVDDKVDSDELRAKLIDYFGAIDAQRHAYLLAGLLRRGWKFDDDQFAALARAIIGSSASPEPTIAALLTTSFEAPDQPARLRALAYLASGAREALQETVRLLSAQTVAESGVKALSGKPKEAADILKAFADMVPHLDANDNIGPRLANKAREIIRASCDGSVAQPESVRADPGGIGALPSRLIEALGISATAPCWAGDDAVKVEAFSKSIARLDPDLQSSLAARLKPPPVNELLSGLKLLALLHPVFWLALLVVSPYSRRLQSVFFWNKTVREVGGLWYVNAIVVSSTMLQKHLLRPFAGKALIADAELSRFDPQFYFEKSTFANDAIRPGDPRRQVAGSAIAFLKQQKNGLIVIGESGLGKTMLLRRFVMDQIGAGEIVAFLNAERCEKGVLDAIAKKLEGVAADEGFLRAMIHRRALHVVIDGLNEVGTQTRHEIVAFVERHRDGQVIISSQPMDWEKPADVPAYRLQPLSDASIEDFLESRAAMLFPEGGPAVAVYLANVKQVLTANLDPARPQTERDSARLLLSNPMDLTLVAEILKSGTLPEIDNLVAQLFHQAAALYATENGGGAFPTIGFSEHVYERRMQDRVDICDDGLAAACSVLERHKILLFQPEPAPGHHFFRHDRFGDFFRARALFPAPLPPRADPNATPAQPEPRWATAFANETRFRGAFLHFAATGPLEDAAKVGDALKAHAVQRRDYSLWSEFERRLMTRQATASARLAA